MSTLLRDVIDIPDRVGADDYVLRLTDSTHDDPHLRAALEQYVVTGSLRGNFLAAIDLVADALTQNTSRAAYLTGSFGSGKSHFMAVLYALLGNNPAVRTRKFDELTGRYDAELAGKQILRLTYHLLGASSLEQAVLRGYVEQIKRLHPEAALPAVHVSDSLLEDAENLRKRMGDEEFLAGLGADSGDDDGWGGLLGAGWDLPRYQAAVHASPEDPERRELVSALANSYFTSFTETADYVDLDRGLVVISEHAKALGYDAVVLFLDELVLWLAFSVRDNEFFARESQKITKLVESSGRSRAIPLISFISRQMDLRKWFADAGASGAEQEALDRAFQYQQSRFREIPLGDDNLAEVAHARLLRPKDEAAQALLGAAFANLTRNPEVWDVLRDSLNTDDKHHGSSEAEFRLTYPFSPVLISTLRNLSSVMQRERTALKVMQRMLVDRRDTLTIDDLIPVGDAFDYIVEGGEPIDGHAAALFRAADDLYSNRLLPSLLDKHSVTADQLDNDPDSVPAGFRGQERIAKTLLLSSIAPNVPALRDITASRLAALNHGSIKARIAGGEARLILGLVRDWSQKDIRRSPSPTASTRSSACSWPTSTISRSWIVFGYTTTPAGAESCCADFHQALGVAADRTTWVGRPAAPWSGEGRAARSTSCSAMCATRPTARAVVRQPSRHLAFRGGLPVRRGGFTLADDINRLDRLLTTGDRHTVVWLPRFFTPAAMEDLATLVKLDWLFTGAGDRWTENSDHLSATDRAQARGILENLFRHPTSFANLLKQAYGIEPPDPKRIAIESTQFDVLTSLSRDFNPQIPRRPAWRTRSSKSSIRLTPAPTPTTPSSSTHQEVTARNFNTCATSRASRNPPRRPGTHQPRHRPESGATHRRTAEGR